MKRHDGRKLSPEAQEALRMRVVAAIQRGMKQEEAVQVFRVARSSINNWLARYRRGGRPGLRCRKRGPKGGTALLPWQAAQTVRAVAGRCPDQLKLSFALWTREAVAEWIEQKFGLRLSVWTVGRYLKRWGLTPQKPLRKAFEQDPEAVRRWLEEEYPAIRKTAQREQAEIHWGDEMGLRSDHQAGRSFGRKGQTPILPGTGQRFRVNVISTVSNRGTLCFAEAGPFGVGEDFFDFGSASGAQVGRGEAVAPAPARTDSDVPVAGLQPGTEPGRVFEQRRQEQRAGTAASGKPGGDEVGYSWLSAEHVASTEDRPFVFSGGAGALCGVNDMMNCPNYSAPISKYIHEGSHL